MRRRPFHGRLPVVWIVLAACTVSSATAQSGKTVDAAFQVRGPTFIALQVRDDSAAAIWYAEVFGLEQVNHLQDADGRYSIRILSGDGLVVEIIAERQSIEAPERHFGLFKTGFYVDDIDAAHGHLAATGVDVDDTIFTDEALGVRTFVLRDPEGNRLQLFEGLKPD